MIQVDIQSAGMSDKGLVRTDNQDQYFVADLIRSLAVRSGGMNIESGSRLSGMPTGCLLMVADGMGGHRAGSEASRLAVQFFINAVLNDNRWLSSFNALTEQSFTDDLERMLSSAHRMLQKQSEDNQELEGMGTTLTMAYVIWPRMIVVHAGDTRCYVLRDQELRLITRDHTVANQMMRSGRLSPDALERSPWSNVLVNALGAGAEDVVADIYKLDLRPNDCVLLCSDGLNKHATDAEIQNALLQNHTPEAACQALIQLANEGGGSDNTTVVVANFFSTQEPVERLKIVQSKPTDEHIILDLAMPDAELDTKVEEGKETSDLFTDTDSTADFPKDE